MTNFKRWLQAASVFQLLTAAFHALSFFADPAPQNETERTLIDLMYNYRQDLGAGMKATMQQLFTALSACFPLLCIFGAWLNFYLLHNTRDIALIRGIMGIEVVVFGLLFVVMAALTFLPPIVCTGLVFAALLIARVLSKKDL
jgi:hypothetical protein